MSGVAFGPNALRAMAKSKSGVEERSVSNTAKSPCEKRNAEVDPHGRHPNAPGAKLDLGKPRAGLLLQDFGTALQRVAEVTTFGADKYTPSGWVAVPDGEQRYFDAAVRHLLATSREDCDSDSGLGHLEHAVWNLLAVIELNTRKPSEKRLAELTDGFDPDDLKPGGTI